MCFLLWDLVLLNSAILFSFIIRNGSIKDINLKEVEIISLLSNLLWVFLLLYKNAYRIIRIERIESILIRTIRLVLIHAVTISAFVIGLKFYRISRLRLFVFYIIFFIFLFVSRVLFMKILKYVRAKGYNFRNVIIVGANDTGEHINKLLSKDLSYGYRVLGFFDDHVDPFSFISTPLLGGFDDIPEFIVNHKIDEMYIALHIDNIKIINKLTALCERNMIRIKFIPDFQLYTKSRKVEISFYENTPVLMLRKEPLELTINRLEKKVFDVCFSFLVIVLIFPWLFPILMLLIKLDSSGPVFFKQVRSGRDNKEFNCIKFRTMYTNKFADELQATQGDIRVTKIGAFMRRTNLDELPQFINVLTGDMSVVGPRPHMLKHTEQYSELISNYLVRHYAKPGITGWAQVNGFRGETKELIEMKDRVDYDIWYIENWNFLLDLKIIYRTIFNVFRVDDNAY
ncbi:undecaprenyl-phosphate glucose phosphotransferase [Flavobacterium luteum]|nr:undecaprenyl-phosphate glucose phosphotransferase [Flavobacterium luteum]